MGIGTLLKRICREMLFRDVWDLAIAGILLKVVSVSKPRHFWSSDQCM